MGTQTHFEYASSNRLPWGFGKGTGFSPYIPKAKVERL